MSLMDYTMCTQTVTVYRNRMDGVQRIVLQNCFLHSGAAERYDAAGRTITHPFLLIVPGPVQQVFAGDRVVEGIGPEVCSWQDVPDTLQVDYATAYHWMGQHCHTEAGKKNREIL